MAPKKIFATCFVFDLFGLVVIKAVEIVSLHDLDSRRLPRAVDDHVFRPVGADVKREHAVRRWQPVRFLVLARRFCAGIQRQRPVRVELEILVLVRYEISEQRMDDLGETLLAAARALGFPIDSRGTVETLRFTKPGLVRRRQRTALAKFDNRPEAIWLYLNRTRHSLTIETPSEFSLSARARMQARLIEVCVERLASFSSA